LTSRLRGAGLRAAHDWLSQYRRYWDASLDRLAELLEAPAPPRRPSSPRHGARKPSSTPRNRKGP
jgi:hypothetical protein